MLKSEKGAVTMVIVVSIIFLITFGMIMYANSIKDYNIQTKTITAIQKAYYPDDVDLEKMYYDLDRWNSTNNSYVVNPPSEEDGIVTSGMVLWYDGENNTSISTHNSSTTTWYDLSGNGKNGTIVGGALWSNNSLVLDGNDDGVSLGDILSTIFNADNTIEMVVNIKDGANRAILFGNFSATNSINYEQTATDAARVWVNSGDADITSTTVFYEQNTDMTLTWVWDKARGEIKHYINGELRETFSCGTVVSNYNYNWNTGYLGRDSRPGATTMKGNIYAVRIYDRALTNEEILRNRNVDSQR